MNSTNTLPKKDGPAETLALAPGSAFWESPALKHRSKHYPEHFDDRVPLTIRMRFTVRPDAWCGAIGGKPGTILRGGEIYPAWTNSHGAVCGICANGERLGVKPDEFDVESFYSPNDRDEGRAGNEVGRQHSMPKKTKTSSKRNAAARSSLARGSMLREEHARQAERILTRFWLQDHRRRLFSEIERLDEKIACLTNDIEQAKRFVLQGYVASVAVRNRKGELVLRDS